VQNEGFVLQSRTLAKMRDDKLKLADNPAFNPALASLVLGARIRSRSASATEVNEAARLAHQAAGGVTPVVDASLSPASNRLIDFFLSKVDVSLLGRSHSAERQGRRARAQHRRGDGQHAGRDLSRVPAARKGRHDGPRRTSSWMARVAELRGQVRKSDQASRTIAAPTGFTRARAPRPA